MININKKSKGFTLVEVVVVIAIMGVLYGIIYSSFDVSRANSRDQQRVSDISAIQLALEQYFNKNGVYPVELDSGASSLISPISFIPQIPKDPSTNKKYNDTTSTNSGYFPMTKTPGSITNCVSYQLWTTFERSNAYLDAKKSFNSESGSLPNNLVECGSFNPKINAKEKELVYDVMP